MRACGENLECQRQTGSQRSLLPTRDNMTLPQLAIMGIGSLHERKSFTKAHYLTQEHFARFEEILPGSADRILALTEREQKAAHESNQADLNFRDKVLASTVAENNKKQNTAVLALSLCLLTSLGLAYQGADIAAGIVGGTTILGVVASFLGNKLSERSARVEQKNKTKDIAKR